MATGARTTYTQSTTQKQAISGLIEMIDWTEAPLLHLLGVSNESKFRIENWPRTTYQWLEDEMSPRTDALDEPLDNSETGVDVDDGTKFKTGDILKVTGSDELMLVNSVSSNTLTVTRGFAGTTATSHDDNAVVTIVTMAALEGANYTTGHTTVVTRPYNYTQILSEAVKVTGSQTVDNNYGITDEMLRQVAKLIGGGEGIGERGKAGKLAILLAQTFYYGYRAAGSATTPRAMGGFHQFVTTNATNLASATLTRKHISDLNRTLVDAGGSPDTIIVGTFLREKISSLFEGSIRTERTEKYGGYSIESIMTDFSDLQIVWDRWAPPGYLYMVEKAKMGWLGYRPFFIEDRAPGGDYFVKDVIGEYGFALCNEEGHGYLYNASTSA